MPKIISAGMIVFMLSATVALWSKTNAVGPATGLNTASGKTIEIPAHAKEVLPGVFDLGTQADPADGRMVQGYAIIHKKETQAKTNAAKPPRQNNTCYGFLASGAKWKTVEPWVVNGENTFGIEPATVFNILDTGVTQWEDAADGVLGNSIGKEIIGNGTSTDAVLEADTTSLDNLNEVYFAELDPGTIGVTIVWGIFGGPPAGRELVGWDQVYNTYYPWSAENEGVTGKMDFANIAVHELGHTFGLADLYTASCSQETMYGYGTEGQTIKRDLNPGDIAGVKALYR